MVYHVNKVLPCKIHGYRDAISISIRVFVRACAAAIDSSTRGIGNLWTLFDEEISPFCFGAVRAITMRLWLISRDSPAMPRESIRPPFCFGAVRAITMRLWLISRDSPAMPRESKRPPFCFGAVRAITMHFWLTKPCGLMYTPRPWLSPLRVRGLEGLNRA